mmetsp:Transcript_111793/g.316512  ORF Transcript_111793/g.316512 Transcript_111793/m.316512 type:complete len:318 (+) Transcript_111793:1007-1960(+)
MSGTSGMPCTPSWSRRRSSAASSAPIFRNSRTSADLWRHRRVLAGTLARATRPPPGATRPPPGATPTCRPRWSTPGRGSPTTCRSSCTPPRASWGSRRSSASAPSSSGTSRSRSWMSRSSARRRPRAWCMRSSRRSAYWRGRSGMISGGSSTWSTTTTSRSPTSSPLPRRRRHSLPTMLGGLCGLHAEEATTRPERSGSRVARTTFARPANRREAPSVRGSSPAAMANSARSPARGAECRATAAPHSWTSRRWSSSPTAAASGAAAARSTTSRPPGMPRAPARSRLCRNAHRATSPRPTSSPPRRRRAPGPTRTRSA